MRNVRLIKERLLKVWVKLIESINKLSLLMSFFLIPILLVKIFISIFSGLSVTSLIQAIVLVLIIYVNKQL